MSTEVVTADISCMFYSSFYLFFFTSCLTVYTSLPHSSGPTPQAATLCTSPLGFSQSESGFPSPSPGEHQVGLISCFRPLEG